MKNIFILSAVCGAIHANENVQQIDDKFLTESKGESL